LGSAELGEIGLDTEAGFVATGAGFVWMFCCGGRYDERDRLVEALAQTAAPRQWVGHTVEGWGGDVVGLHRSIERRVDQLEAGDLVDGQRPACQRSVVEGIKIPEPQVQR
jgi:hypothetical protein